MTYSFRPFKDPDSDAVLGIFNHYVENSFAAFPEAPMGKELIDHFLKASDKYPVLVVVSDNGDVVGFGFVNQYFPLATLDRTGLVGYFLHPDHCGKGIGSRLLEDLIEKAGDIGIDTLIAMASAQNEGSIRFHLNNGFHEVGRFHRVGRKFGQDVDQVWFQRFI
jgi:phosphinothricin acetyltransferase